MNASDKKKCGRILEMRAEAKDMADRLDRMKEEAEGMLYKMLRKYEHVDLPEPGVAIVSGHGLDGRVRSVRFEHFPKVLP